MMELDFYNGDYFIIFDVIEINDEKQTITVAISNQGRISQDTFQLLEDSKFGKLEESRYFEYGVNFDKIYIDYFISL